MIFLTEKIVTNLPTLWVGLEFRNTAVRRYAIYWVFIALQPIAVQIKKAIERWRPLTLKELRIPNPYYITTSCHANKKAPIWELLIYLLLLLKRWYNK